MKKQITRLAVAATIALSLLASTDTAFAKDAAHGRGTAWTDLAPLPVPVDVPIEDVLEPLGVTWE